MLHHLLWVYDWIMKTIDYVVDGITWNPTPDPTTQPTKNNTDSACQYFLNFVMAMFAYFVSVLYIL